MTDLPYLLCKLQADVPPTVAIPWSVWPVPCAGCGRDVLASPASRGMIQRGEAQPVCRACLPRAGYVPVMTVEQVAEFVRMQREGN